VGRWQARLFDTRISDAQLRAALASPLQDEGGLLSSLRSDDRPAFFIAPDRKGKIVNALRQHFPDVEALAVDAADEICEHVFDLLGSGPVRLGKQIDWHVDFKTGHRWNPRQYFADVQPASYPGGYDIKVPWELSRCQHFAWLGQAYWFTGDEKYAREFAAQVLDWIEQNPSRFGVNWACTMDVAIRVVNWLWGYYFSQGSPHLADEFLITFCKSLLAHGRFIIKNLERTPWLTTNHYLADLVGLIYLGILLPEFKEAHFWRDFGLRELWAEMFTQSYPDGVDFEASISYHCLAVELFLSAIILCQLNGISVPGKVMERLEKMLEFVLYYTKPDGTIPLIGDCDNGRLHRLKGWSEPEREWVDHRYLLAMGAVLFEREDFGRIVGDQWEEAFWLLGERAVAYKEQLNHKELPLLRPESRAFRDGGLYIMRHDDMYMIVDAGSNGQNGQGGHAHNDTLSFELFTSGQSWIVDPGTYVYTTDYEARNLFRSAAYHNVMVVDGMEQNRLDARLPFFLGHNIDLQVRMWKSESEYDFFWGSLQGFHRDPELLVYHRQVYFQKAGQPFWLIRDVLEGTSQHCVEQYFHFAPSIQVVLGENHLQVSGSSDKGMAILFPPNTYSSFELLEGWLCPSYGVRVKALVARCVMMAELPVEFVTVLRSFASDHFTLEWLNEARGLATDGLQRMLELTR